MELLTGGLACSVPVLALIYLLVVAYSWGWSDGLNFAKRNKK